MEKMTRTERCPIPAHPTKEEYLAEKKLIRDTYTAMAVFTAILMGPIIVVTLLLWAADFFSSCVTCVIALLIIGIPTIILLSAVAEIFQEENKRMRQLTKNYMTTVREESCE